MGTVTKVKAVKFVKEKFVNLSYPNLASTAGGTCPLS